MKNRFKEYSKFNLSDINKEVLQKWDAENVFAESMKIREGHPSFVFLRRSPLSQRHAGHSPRHGTYYQRHLLPL